MSQGLQPAIRHWQLPRPSGLLGDCTTAVLKPKKLIFGSVDLESSNDEDRSTAW
jgi:hypothetical protein